MVNALISGSIYALASAGLSLTYGLLRILNFAHGHLMMTGAYLFFLFSQQLEFPLFTAALCTIAATLVLAAVSLRVFITPFMRYSLFLPLVTTLALSSILEALISIFFGVNVRSLSSGMDISSMHIQFTSPLPIEIFVTPIQILIITSALILMAVLAVFIHHTPFGRQVRAISENSYSAESLGVHTTRVTFLIFAIGTLLAAYAGILVGYETNLQPTMGNAYTMKAFAAMVLGGLGNIWGTMAGCYILGLIENLSIGLDFGDFSIPAGYKDAFAFVIILGVLLCRPQGLFRRKQRQS